MKRYLKKHLAGGLMCCIVAFLLVFAISAQAEYEISKAGGDLIASVPTDGTIVSWTGDVEVQWEKPDMSAAGDSLIGFLYKWNTSATDWDGTGEDGTVDPNLDPPIVTKAASFFANDDSSSLRYLHVITKYLDISSGGTVSYSSDVIIGPINIDNVAPAGTVKIVDSQGTEIASTRNTLLDIKLSATVAPTKMYLSETSSRPTTGATYDTEAQYDLSDTDPGTKTIYAWFEDGVGNISTAPATDTVTLLAPVSISPNTATIDLNVGTQVFKVDGTTAAYDWSIIEASPADVASISGATNGNSVTVAAAKEGTFKIQATDGTDTVTSGTITVITSTVSKTFSLITTATTNTNTIGFVLENTGYTTAHELGTAVGNCDLVSKWVVSTQSYLSHPMAVATYNNFSLEIGAVYFVSVTADHDFDLTGTLPSSGNSSLTTTATTNTNAIGLPYSKSGLTTAHLLGQDIGNCDLVTKWVAATQSYLSHPMYVSSYNNFSIEWGEGYFISVTQDTPWSW